MCHLFQINKKIEIFMYIFKNLQLSHFLFNNMTRIAKIIQYDENKIIYYVSIYFVVCICINIYIILILNHT